MRTSATPRQIVEAIEKAPPFPNSKRENFRLIPAHVWPVTASCAQLRGADLGKPAALPVPATIGDFHIPQYGLLANGNPEFEP